MTPEQQQDYARAAELFKKLDEYPADAANTPELAAMEDELDAITARILFGANK